MRVRYANAVNWKMTCKGCGSFLRVETVTYPGLLADGTPGPRSTFRVSCDDCGAEDKSPNYDEKLAEYESNQRLR